MSIYEICITFIIGEGNSFYAKFNGFKLISRNKLNQRTKITLEFQNTTCVNFSRGIETLIDMFY